MAVCRVEQTNPPHYALQVMHATGLVCSSSAAYYVLLKSSRFSGDNERSLFYVNRKH